jgi:hypothetical protein
MRADDDALVREEAALALLGFGFGQEVAPVLATSLETGAGDPARVEAAVEAFFMRSDFAGTPRADLLARWRAFGAAQENEPASSARAARAKLLREAYPPLER